MIREIELKKEVPALESWKVISKRKFSFGENWDDLTEKQFLKIGKILSKNMKSDAAYLDIFFAVSKLSKLWAKMHMTDDEMFTQLVEGFSKPLLNGKKMKKGILANSVRGFTGVKDRMKNLVWKQFYLADSLFNQWEKTKDVKFLDMLCAILYSKGDFDSEKAEDYFKMWRKKPIGFKIAVSLNYKLLKANLPETYPELYKAPKKNTQVKQSNPKQLDYLAITINLSGGEFGTREQVDKEPMHNVLKLLELNMIKSKKKK